MMNALPFYQRNKFIFFSAFIFSLLLSIFIIWRGSIINPDSICYLLAADTFGKTGIKETMHLCGQARWPFYSIIIYLLSANLHISYAIAAYTLNALFTGISVVFFLLLIKKLGGTTKTLWLAAATILLWHEFNNVREYIIRDHGFWSLYLISIYCLISYLHAPKLRFALAWGASTFLATLFRIEGLIFLTCIPFITLFLSPNYWENIKKFLALNLLSVSIGLTIILFLILNPQHTVDELGRLKEVIMQLQQGGDMIINKFQVARTILSEKILTEDAIRQTGIVLSLLLITWYLVNVLTNLSWIYGVLAVYGIWVAKIPLAYKRLLASYLIINIVVTLVFLLEHYFLSQRYLIALSLTALIFVPFALETLLNKSKQLAYKLLLVAIVMAILIQAIGGLIDFGYSKSYIKEAGAWLEQYVPENARLYINDYQLMYYSRHYGERIFDEANYSRQIKKIANGNWKKYDYLAVLVNRKHHEQIMPILKEINLKPIQVFANKRGDKIVIYQIKKDK